MQSLKEALRETIEQLTEDEARQILEFLYALQKRNGITPTLAYLARHPALTLPRDGFKTFRRVEPVPARGLAASRLLIEDRR